MSYIKINGCGFHVEAAALSLEDFKKEFKFSFCKGKTDEEIEAVHNQLKEITSEKKTEDNVNSQPIKEKTSGGKRKGNGVGSTCSK